MKTRSIRFAIQPVLTALLAAATAGALGSCAYYNTFYVARKYYARATQGQPYRVDRVDSPDNTSLNKAIDFSKKLMANYPKSKWVDDAYLLWAKSYLAKNDPLQTVTMLGDFATRFPDSPLLGEAAFYRAVALRQARRYAEALQSFDEYLAGSPRGELLPYAHLERSRTLRSLDRHADAAAAAGVVVDRWPKSPLALTARIARADANLVRGAFEEARTDFHLLGMQSTTDDQRLEYLLRESECLEAARRYDEALALLRSAIGHENPPPLPDTTGGRPLIIVQTPGFDRYGRLLTRIGTVQLMSGAAPQALESYRRVVAAYPRGMVAAEAQYRIGYAYEIGADDFESARVEYGKVREVNASSPFVAQATQRQATLEQLARFRTAGGDSAEKRAQGGLLLAEQYLFQLDKPDRALTEYSRVAEENLGNPWGGKALNAYAWVLRKKFDKRAEAESLYWRVVREYPATEAQIAARDYLEELGHTVPAELIKLPPPPPPRRDTTTSSSPRPPGTLTPIPSGTPILGQPGSGANPDSLARAAAARSAVFGAGRPMPGSPFAPGGPAGRLMAADSTATLSLATPDSAAAAARPTMDPPGAAGFAHTGPPIVAVPPAMVVPPAPARPESLSASDPASPGAPAAPAPEPAPFTMSRTLADSSASDSTAADSSATRKPLPPLEVSPVRPGITFPSGPPRQFGAPALASGTDPSRARPGTRPTAVVGAPPRTGATPGRAPADSLRAPGTVAALDSLRLRAVAVRDSLRRRREPGFEPRGSHIQ